MAENETAATNEETNSDSAGIDNLKVLENIEVKLTVEVGSTELKIRDLLRLNEGSVVELERLAGDPLDILANGVKIAKGECSPSRRCQFCRSRGGMWLWQRPVSSWKNLVWPSACPFIAWARL